ncbi:MAG: NUDIX hydrolase [Lentisphaerae bacterium]|nr:NUDIX hydrolase [Lentisphaerota bacterium]
MPQGLEPHMGKTGRKTISDAGVAAVGGEKTIRTQRVFSGRLLRVEVQDIEMASGHRSVREIVRHPGAVLVLARTDDGRFVFVRQFRKAIERDLLEVIAGTLEPGEKPAACARREVREESGFRVKRLRSLGAIYTVPGFCTERIFMFFAELCGRPEAPCPDHDEVVRVEFLRPAQVEAALRRGAIEDAKTMAAWLAYRLRDIA